jgi:Type IV secretion system pilin
MTLEFIKFFSAVGEKCNPGGGGGFLGFPTWYKYLGGVKEYANPLQEQGEKCVPKMSGINDTWLVALAITDILLRIAIIAAIIFVLIGGFKYITSRANPDKTAAAKNTIVDGLVGVVIAVVATAVLSFVAGRFN